MNYNYSILDPTGNITLLVETLTDPSVQPAAAAALMKKHPEAEQTGFVRFYEKLTDTEAPVMDLRMAGGEFCGNASMCAAVLYVLQKCPLQSAQKISLKLNVSGTSRPVSVRVKRIDDVLFHTEVLIPPALRIEERLFCHNGKCGRLPVIFMEGITHILISAQSCFFSLLQNPKTAEQVIQTWCEELSAEGLGMLFFQERKDHFCLTPLVYIPGSRTVFWENSCASGSCAAGMYLAAEKNQSVNLTLKEPGGILTVKSSPETEQTWLCGTVRFLGDYSDLCEPEQI